MWNIRVRSEFTENSWDFQSVNRKEVQIQIDPYLNEPDNFRAISGCMSAKIEWDKSSL